MQIGGMQAYTPMVRRTPVMAGGDTPTSSAPPSLPPNVATNLQSVSTGIQGASDTIQSLSSSVQSVATQAKGLVDSIVNAFKHPQAAPVAPAAPPQAPAPPTAAPASNLQSMGLKVENFLSNFWSTYIQPFFSNLASMFTGGH